MKAVASRGFSLIEVLVALLVVAFGLLGMAAIQGDTLSTTTGARNESTVALEAESMADAIAANTGYWAAYAFPTAAITVNGATLSDSTLNGYSTNCTSNSCSPAEMASYDLKRWGADLSNLLPNGSGSVTCTTGTPGTCTITVDWTVKASTAVNAGTESSTSTSKSYSLVTAL